VGAAKSSPGSMDAKVEPDGRYTIRGATNSVPGPYFDCMKGQFKVQPYSEWAKTQKKEHRPPGSAQGVDRGMIPGRSRRAAHRWVLTSNRGWSLHAMQALRWGEQGRSYSYWPKFPVRTYRQYNRPATIRA
jgi:hypothetical protein